MLLNLWKMLKYSPVTFSFFEKVQNSEGLAPLKILNCATTQWLSHCAATQRVISWFSLLIDALDTIYFEKQNAYVKGVRDLLLRANVILFMLLLASVLVYVNRFSHFLRIHSLVYSIISGKLNQLTNSLGKLQNEEGLYFKQHGRRFLKITKEWSELSRQTLQHDNRADVSIDEIIESFKAYLRYKTTLCHNVDLDERLMNFFI